MFQNTNISSQAHVIDPITFIFGARNIEQNKVPKLIEEVSQNRYCISSATENIVMEVSQNINLLIYQAKESLAWSQQGF